MDVILFGATGMVGEGVLLECLRDASVKRVLAIVRRPTGHKHAKLRELTHDEFTDLTAIESELRGYDACFFCLGISSAGMSEEDYRRTTYDITLAAAESALRANPTITFIYLSAAGADRTEKGRIMWARVKGAAENAILAMKFNRAYVFRPAYIQPMSGIVARERWIRIVYRLVGPTYPLLKRIFPKYVTTTETMGRAMINVGRNGGPSRVLHSIDIENAATAHSS